MLCHSLAGNAVYVVTVTSRGVGRLEGRMKKAVVVTARVHPGETNSSWMMEGFLDFLLGDSEDAQLLRDTFVFKVRDLLRSRCQIRVHICIVILVICAAAGGANVESRWCGGGQLPLLPGRQGPQQKLQDIAPGFFSLCLAHPKHGGEVRQDIGRVKM